MNLRNLLVYVFCIFLVSCNSNKLFTQEKKPSLEGQRVPLIQSSKDLVKTAADIDLTLADANEIASSKDYQWNRADRMVKIFSANSQDFPHNNAPFAFEEGNIYKVSPNGALTCISLTGDIVWRNDDFVSNELSLFSSSRYMAGGIAIHAGSIFATNGTRDIISLDKAMGKTLFVTKIASPARAIPVVYKDILIIQALDNSIYAINAIDGRELWSYKNPDINLVHGVSFPQGVIVGDMLISKLNSEDIIAINPDNGLEIWNASLLNYASHRKAKINFASTVHYLDGYVYATSFDGKLFAIHSETGEVKYKKDLYLTSDIKILGDVIFAISEDSDLVCVHAKTGDVIWTSPLKSIKKAKNLNMFNTPFIVNYNAKAYVCVLDSKGMLYYFDIISGEFLHEEKLKGVHSAIVPQLVSGSLVISALNDEIILY